MMQMRKQRNILPDIKSNLFPIQPNEIIRLRCQNANEQFHTLRPFSKNLILSFISGPKNLMNPNCENFPKQKCFSQLNLLFYETTGSIHSMKFLVDIISL